MQIKTKLEHDFTPIILAKIPLKTSNNNKFWRTCRGMETPTHHGGSVSYSSNDIGVQLGKIKQDHPYDQTLAK